MLLKDLPDVRVGHGTDVHKFIDGKKLMLGCVEIDHPQGLEGHSDADVLAHAITDAILGALADGDIGTHFPPSDDEWKDKESKIFLLDAARRVKDRQGMIAFIDATVICEEPKLSKYRDEIRMSIANILDIEVNRVGLKATTTEGLGLMGRKEGIAAMAVATLRLPGD